MNILWGILKWLLGMKFIWIIVIVAVVVILITLIHNISSGAFSLAKFAGGFNIFSGPVQGKLIYYAIIFAIGAAIALGIYAKFTQSTYDYNTSYKNNIHDNGNVTIDQRVNEPEKKYLFRLGLLGLDIKFLELGVAKSTTVIDNSKVKPTTPPVGSATVKVTDAATNKPVDVVITPPVKKVSTIGKVFNFITTPIRWLKKIGA